MSTEMPTTEFRGKTWFYVVLAVVFGGLAVFGLVLGPLFLFEIAKDARGQPAPDAGLALTIMSVPLTLAFALFVFNAISHRRPILRVCREGLVIRLIGTSALDHVPLVPAILRLLWAIASFQGFRQRIVFVPWDSLRSLEITGLPMNRKLLIGQETGRSQEFHETKIHLFEMTLSEAAFAVSLDVIAGTIAAYFRDEQSRQDLPSWEGTS